MKYCNETDALKPKKLPLLGSSKGENRTAKLDVFFFDGSNNSALISSFETTQIPRSSVVTATKLNSDHHSLLKSILAVGYGASKRQPTALNLCTNNNIRVHNDINSH